MVIWIKVTTFSLQRRRCWNRLSKNEVLAVYIRDNFLQAVSNFATIPSRETSRQKYLALTYEIIKRKDSQFLRRHSEMRERIPVLWRGKERDNGQRVGKGKDPRYWLDIIRRNQVRHDSYAVQPVCNHSHLRCSSTETSLCNARFYQYRLTLNKAGYMFEILLFQIQYLQYKYILYFSGAHESITYVVFKMERLKGFWIFLIQK